MEKLKPRKAARKPRPIRIYLFGRYQYLNPVDVAPKEIRNVAKRLLKFADWADSRKARVRK